MSRFAAPNNWQRAAVDHGLRARGVQCPGLATDPSDAGCAARVRPTRDHGPRPLDTPTTPTWSDPRERDQPPRGATEPRVHSALPLDHGRAPNDLTTLGALDARYALVLPLREHARMHPTHAPMARVQPTHAHRWSQPPPAKPHPPLAHAGPVRPAAPAHPLPHPDATPLDAPPTRAPLAARSSPSVGVRPWIWMIAKDQVPAGLAPRGLPPRSGTKPKPPATLCSASRNLSWHP